MDVVSTKRLNKKQYLELYASSLSNPEQFWQICADSVLSWFEPYKKVYTGNFYDLSGVANRETNKWFEDGKLNASYNCIDRHLSKHSDKIAYHWQGDNLNESVSITYQELHDRVCKLSNILLTLGISKGDKVCIYLPLSIEGVVAMLACARIGAVHTVVFAGFSATALAQRIIDAECKLLITSDLTKRGGKELDLWDYVANCAEQLTNSNYHLSSILILDNYYSSSQEISSLQTRVNNPTIDINHYNTFKVPTECPPVWMDAEDPLFILYTSGSTGKPKGVVHTTGGYLLHTIYSFNELFHPQDNDVYWCTADIGWVAGHSYVVYGALGCGSTSVIFGGIPEYPQADIFWQIIDKFKVSIFYTAPTAIRALMAKGDKYLETTKRDSLRILGSVGEPINPEAWQWFSDKVGLGKSAIMDTWWQTETGATMLAPFVKVDQAHEKPGCAQSPFFGLEFAILDEQGNEINEHTQGNLVFKRPWPGMLRTLNNDHEKFIETYLTPYKNYFYTGDIARCDDEGDYWLLGRSDDVLNIAGHRFGTAEIESALIANKLVSEAAVVPMPDPIKGQALMAYIVLNNDNKNHDQEEIKKILVQHVRKEIGPIAIIKNIKFVSGLPKTRSGKIMRRILKKIAANEVKDIKDLGDLSTLTNHEIIKELI